MCRSIPSKNALTVSARGTSTHSSMPRPDNAIFALSRAMAKLSTYESPLVITFKTYFIKQGLRDGVHGLILSVFAGMFTFVKYSKAWDLLRRKTEAGG